MAFKFPFTNYHELNLTWVLDQLKKLFEESAENVTVIENYNGRLTAVETELPLVADTAQGAAQSAAAAASLAQQAKSTADTAQENAIQAQGAAGQARQEAQAAQSAADAATQAAQQAQATAQNFDGRITEAQNNASEALEASRSFENRVQAAITTANNAAQTATNAQGIATRADQNAGAALDTAQLADRKAGTAQETAERADRKANQNASNIGNLSNNIGNLSNLTTEEKDNLVEAINEVAQTASGAVTSVNGKTGVVIIDSNDIGFNLETAYNSGTVGAELKKLNKEIDLTATPLKWNQLAVINESLFPSTSAGITFSYVNGKINITGQANGRVTTAGSFVLRGIVTVPNHKYLLLLSTPLTGGLKVRVSSGLSPAYSSDSWIATASSPETNLYISFDSLIDISGTEINITGLQLAIIDLTEMELENITVEEFNSLFPSVNFTYNSGEVLNVPSINAFLTLWSKINELQALILEN